MDNKRTPLVLESAKRLVFRIPLIYTVKEESNIVLHSQRLQWIDTVQQCYRMPRRLLSSPSSTSEEAAPCLFSDALFFVHLHNKAIVHSANKDLRRSNRKGVPLHLEEETNIAHLFTLLLLLEIKHGVNIPSRTRVGVFNILYRLLLLQSLS